MPFLKFLLKFACKPPLGMFSEDLLNVVAVICDDSICPEYVPLDHRPQYKDWGYLLAARGAR